MKKLITILSVALLFTSCCKKADLTQGSPDWKESFPGVWVSEVGTPDKLNLLNATSVTPRSKELTAKSKTEFPLNPSKIKYVTKNGKTYLTFPLEADEQIYGLGLNFKGLNQRGAIKQLHMDHYGSSDNGRTHAPIPFFVSSKGYGVLLNTARYIDIWVGSAVRTDSENPAIATDRTTDPNWSAQPYSDNIEVYIPTEGLEIIMFGGNSMMDVVSRYTLYTGGGFIPPKWGLGFWQRTPTKFSDVLAKEEADGFLKNNFPLDVIGLEPGWHSYAYPCSFEWDKTRFPNADAFVKEMNDRNIKINLWANPYISPESELAKPIDPYVGTHTVWCGTVPDFTMPEARKLFTDHIVKNQLSMGVSGYKIDEVDGFDCWLWPDVAMFPSGNEADQIRSVYGNLVMNTILDAYKAKNERTFGMVRAANAGAANLPFVLYNDNYSHRDFITAISSASFIGVHWTPEVRASKDSEEWLRRMQTTCFAPMALVNAWADGTKPWSFPDVYKGCQDAAFLRMRLLPYLYSTYAQYYLEGTPPFRAMNLVEGYKAEVKKIKGKLDGTENPYEMATFHEIKDQYMMGDNILVAPIFAGETSRIVVLPEGKWYNFHTGALAGESEVITIDAEKDKIPLFVRDGGVIPMIPAISNTSEWRAGQPLEVRVYGEKEGSFNLYDDDGTSFDYEKGAYTIKKLSSNQTIEDVVSNGNWSYKDVNWVSFK